jgi:hypothetical protein
MATDPALTANQQFIVTLVVQLVTLVGLLVPVILALINSRKARQQVAVIDTKVEATQAKIATVDTKIDDNTAKTAEMQVAINGKMEELTDAIGRAAKAEGQVEILKEAVAAAPTPLPAPAPAPITLNVQAVPPPAPPTRSPGERTRASDLAPPPTHDPPAPP